MGSSSSKKGKNNSKHNKKGQKNEASDTEGKIFNVVILGTGGVGKSALAIQFVQDKFVKDYDPTIEDSYRKQTIVDSKPAMLTIWDTAGQEEYEALHDGYIKEADGFIIVYSITNRRSFESVGKYWKKVAMIKSQNEPIIIFGNKCDMEASREVPTAEGKKLSELLGCDFMETSAKSKSGDEGFHLLVRKMRETKSKKV